nr:11-beta-hydroxysteroid dehydrogenase 1B-like [Coffea arabica]
MQLKASKGTTVTGESSGIGEVLYIPISNNFSLMHAFSMSSAPFSSAFLAVYYCIFHLVLSLSTSTFYDTNTSRNPISLFVVDHLVNNAGIASMCLIETAIDITEFEPVIVIFKILASKAALLSIYETMRAELAPEISITTATLGVIEPEMSKGKYLDREGITQVNSDSASVRYLDLIKMSNFFSNVNGGCGCLQTFINQLPVMSTSACAKSIVVAICRKERYVTEPKWRRVFFLLKTFCPELVEFANHMYCLQMKAWLAKKSSLPPSEHKTDKLQNY